MSDSQTLPQTIQSARVFMNSFLQYKNADTNIPVECRLPFGTSGRTSVIWATHRLSLSAGKTLSWVHTLGKMQSQLATAARKA